jgi:hypothetical protein
MSVSNALSTGRGRGASTHIVLRLVALLKVRLMAGGGVLVPSPNAYRARVVPITEHR